MEQELLILSNDFKNRMKKKNIIIAQLKKLVCILYGLVVITDETGDVSLIAIIRQKLSEALNTHLNVESDDEEEQLIEVEIDISNIS